MSLLTICQDAANEIGVPSPSTVVGSTDTTNIQLLAAANREGKNLVAGYDWQTLIKEEAHTTLAAESQGDMSTIASDFLRFSNDTMWNRTTDRKYYGPLNNAQWQRLKASVSSGITNYFRIRGNALLFHPAPPAGESVFFEYIGKNWAITSGSTANATSFAADANTTVLDEDLITLGVIWRFLKQKGLPYDNQFQEYRLKLSEKQSKDGAKQIIRMAGPNRLYLPVNEPEGNFSL
jgi:hypothetical protein|tara:strand:+ start:306 stop:1010 length:705 start_codon:yes stop_codon:yes gene_type:complete